MRIFGQTPPDVSGALFQSKNLSDVPDKAAARDNLQVPSLDQVLYSSLPVGVLLSYAGEAAPAGFLPCNGQTVSSETFPELVDVLNPGGSNATLPSPEGSHLLCIKAYNSVRNYSSGLNIPGLVSDYSTLNNEAIRTSFFTGNQALSPNGYQKLPGGLIIQWMSGTTSATNGADSLMNLPITFPVTILQATATFSGVGSSPYNDITTPVIIKSMNSSSVTVLSHSGLGNTVSIIAVGY